MRLRWKDCETCSVASPKLLGKTITIKATDSIVEFDGGDGNTFGWVCDSREMAKQFAEEQFAHMKRESLMMRAMTETYERRRGGNG